MCVEGGLEVVEDKDAVSHEVPSFASHMTSPSARQAKSLSQQMMGLMGGGGLGLGGGGGGFAGRLSDGSGGAADEDEVWSSFLPSRCALSAPVVENGSRTPVGLKPPRARPHIIASFPNPSPFLPFASFHAVALLKKGWVAGE